MKSPGFIVWMCVTNTLLSSASPPSLSIIKCEILEYTSITCYWETSNHTDYNSYRLQVNITFCHSEESFICEGVCDTRESQCSIQPINSAFHCFCAEVLASTNTGSFRSPPFCFNGVNQVKLHPPTITRLGPSAGRPGCIQVCWEMRYTLPDIEKSHRWIQVEYTTHDETRSNMFRAYSKKEIELCDLYPGSRYTVKLRAQDSRAAAHWSSWTSKDFMMMEKAPSAAPRLWRRIQPADEKRKRRLTLLWKPLSWTEANGVVVSYAASCHSDVDSSQWTCGPLDGSQTSCDLTVSDDAYECSLRATNSAGTSPLSYIHIPAHNDPVSELPCPERISVVSLDDTRLKLAWTTAVNQSEDGFVVQWISVLDDGRTSVDWIYLNKTSRSFIITGLLPEVLYNLSVMNVYDGKAGSDTSVMAFTREGAPSVGPQLTVKYTGGQSIHLQWVPVPLEKLHGFIKHYSILYSINGKEKREQVKGDVEQISLNGLTEGIYNICVMAHTVEGSAAGPWQMVAVGHDDVQVVPVLLCALLLISIILITPVCMRVRIKQCLCPKIPDPSTSSLSVWCKPSQHKQIPSTTVSSFFPIGQTSCYHGYSEKNHCPVQVLSFHSIHHVHDGTDCEMRTNEPLQHFQTDYTIQTYVKPNQILSQDDYQSLKDSFTESMAQQDLCDYIHVSQSYTSVVTTVDEYRTLNSDECSDVLCALPDDHKPDLHVSMIACNNTEENNMIS